MQNEKYISFIVPMYNKENEVDRLIQSIFSFDLNEEIEVIIIDDKSKDNSIQRVKNNPNYEKIKLIECEKNLGVHGVRNKGIENASGKWLIFLDADDFLNVNGLAQIYDNFKKYENLYDVVFFSYVTDGGEKTGLINEGEYEAIEYISEYTNDNKFIFRKDKDCLYCVKRDLVIKNNIRWKFTNLDYIFRNEIVYYANKFIFVDNFVATYVKNTPNSLTKQRKKIDVKLDIVNKRIKYQIDYLLKYKEFFKNNRGAYKYFKRIFYDYKYASNRYIYLSQILHLNNYLNCNYAIRFIVVAFLPIRTFSKIIDFIKNKVA